MATYDQTQQVIEFRNCFGNDPGYRPQHHRDYHPSPYRKQTAPVHMLGTAEHADINVLAGDVAINHPSNHNLQRQLPVDRMLSS